MVSSISAEMILAFTKYQGKKKATLQDMFKSLSLEMGGDGNSITKSQLSSYIQKAESGATNISPTRLKALKKMLDNWDNISQNGDNITFDDLKSMPMLLFDAAVGDLNDANKRNKTNVTDNSEKFDLKEYLKTTLNITDNQEITKSNVESLFKSLLADSSTDETPDLIDNMVNILASFEKISTVSTQA